MQVCAKYYELLSHCIPPTVILKVRVIALTVVTYPIRLWQTWWSNEWTKPSRPM